MSLLKLKNRNYVPYSGQPSCSVVRSKAGRYFPGVRVENVSFPLTIDAVESALFCCLSERDEPEELFVQQPEQNIWAFWQQEYNLKIKPIEELEDIDFHSLGIEINARRIPGYLAGLLDQAVALNSNFPVAALLETNHGFISGVNIECSEWNLGLCAERVVLAKARAYGYTDFGTLYIHAKFGEYCSPCGACRQVLAEQMPNQRVHLIQPDHTHSEHFCTDLLPYSFTSSALQQHS